jgi:hypothetical protein
MRLRLFERQVAYDEEFDKHYLLCDYNRDGDSYRSVVVLTIYLLLGAFDTSSLIHRGVIIFRLCGTSCVSVCDSKKRFLIYFRLSHSDPRGLASISRNWRMVCSRLQSCGNWSKRPTMFSPSIVTSEVPNSLSLVICKNSHSRSCLYELGNLSMTWLG